MPIDDDNPQPDVEGSWRNQAACVGYPYTWWFPVRPKGRPQYDYEPGLAEAICKYCLVKDSCALAGLREPEGIWGGEVKPSRRA